MNCKRRVRPPCVPARYLNRELYDVEFRLRQSAGTRSPSRGGVPTRGGESPNETCVDTPAAGSGSGRHRIGNGRADGESTTRAGAGAGTSAEVRGRVGQAEQGPDGRAGTTQRPLHSHANGEVLHRRRVLLGHAVTDVSRDRRT